jgi:dCMP deaminase
MISNKRDKEWDLYFLRIAKAVGENSKCLSRRIGAIIVRDKLILSSGYNGPPVGYIHCGEKIKKGETVQCPRRRLGYPSGQGLEICPAVHAERNTVLAAAKNGTATDGATLYCYCGFPCKDCLIEIINAGIKEIVCIKEIGRPFLYDGLSEEIFRYYEKLGLLHTYFYSEEEV